MTRTAPAPVYTSPGRVRRPKVAHLVAPSDPRHTVCGWPILDSWREPPAETPMCACCRNRAKLWYKEVIP